MFAGGVAVQDLQEEYLDGNDRSEHRIVPRHARVTTRLFDGDRRKFFGPVLLEMSNDIRDTYAWWRLLCERNC